MSILEQQQVNNNNNNNNNNTAYYFLNIFDSRESFKTIQLSYCDMVRSCKQLGQSDNLTMLKTYRQLLKKVQHRATKYILYYSYRVFFKISLLYIQIK